MTNNTTQEHPGGAKIILKYAGKDCTSAFEPIHPPDALDKNLSPDKHLGELNAQDSQKLNIAIEGRKKTYDELRMEKAQKEKPPISRVLNAQDLEVCRSEVVTPTGTLYFPF